MHSTMVLAAQAIEVQSSMPPWYMFSMIDATSGLGFDYLHFNAMQFWWAIHVLLLLPPVQWFSTLNIDTFDLSLFIQSKLATNTGMSIIKYSRCIPVQPHQIHEVHIVALETITQRVGSQHRRNMNIISTSVVCKQLLWMQEALRSQPSSTRGWFFPCIAPTVSNAAESHQTHL